jgi:hypothetical protein
MVMVLAGAPAAFALLFDEEMPGYIKATTRAITVKLRTMAPCHL